MHHPPYEPGKPAPINASVMTEKSPRWVNLWWIMGTDWIVNKDERGGGAVSEGDGWCYLIWRSSLVSSEIASISWSSCCVGKWLCRGCRGNDAVAHPRLVLWSVMERPLCVQGVWWSVFACALAFDAWGFGDGFMMHGFTSPALKCIC